jgi:nitrite reductase/ring-hydroxylating ferredoxin subunit
MWTDVLAAGELRDDEPRLVDADGTAVMVVRHGGELYALSDRCSHLGEPLHEGTIADCRITCPEHDSVFGLRDGALIHGPAAWPQPAWDVRVRAGRVEVCPRNH